jgi:hypothetical protein
MLCVVSGSAGWMEARRQVLSRFLHSGIRCIHAPLTRAGNLGCTLLDLLLSAALLVAKNVLRVATFVVQLRQKWWRGKLLVDAERGVSS